MRAFVNGTFLSCEEENRVFSVLVEERGRIAYAGDALPAAYAGAERIDLAGAAAVPAFGDTHIHFSNYALFCSTLDVRAAADFEALARMLRAYEAAHPRAKVLAAYGLSQHTLRERRLPTGVELDGMTKLPTMIITAEGHGAVVNAPLARTIEEKLAGVDGADFEKGQLWREAYYRAVDLVTGRVPMVDIVAGLSIAGDRMAHKGIGFFQTVEGVGYPGDLDVRMVQLLRRGLPQAVQVFFQTLDAARTKQLGLTTIGGCFAAALDGACGTQDAALMEPYANDPENRGMLVYPQDTVSEFCRAAHDAGLQIGMHVIGDRAIEQLLTAFEAIGEDLSARRHTLIHADMIREEQIARAARLGVRVANQPIFLDNPEEPLSYLREVLGETRADRLMPNRSLLEAGVRVSAGSDAPCGAVDPMLSIHRAVNHPLPAERVSVLDALRMHTLYAAESCFLEQERGSLVVGKRADFAVLSENPLAADPAWLSEIAVREVYFAGKRYAQKPCGALGMLLRAIRGAR